MQQTFENILKNYFLNRLTDSIIQLKFLLTVNQLILSILGSLNLSKSQMSSLSTEL